MLKGYKAVVGIVIFVWASVPVLCADSGSTASTSEGQIEVAKNLITSEDPYQQKLGFLRLEALRDPNTVGFIEALTLSEDAHMRAMSLRALFAVQGKSVVPRLVEVAQNDPDSVVRREVLLALEPMLEEMPAVLDVAIQALKDQRTRVRVTAVDMLSRMDDPKAKQALLKSSKQYQPPAVRMVLNDVLSE